MHTPNTSSVSKKIKVTTSWDDGDVLDLRLANLLTKYGIKGTFYITKNYRAERLSDSNIREISKSHEVGAHTLTHPDLRTLSGSPEKLAAEISGGKQWLEEITGEPVRMFCYPKGLHDDASAAAAKNAGFLGARTTSLASIDHPSADPFRMSTTLQVYPFPFRKIDASHLYVGKILEPFRQRAPGLRALGVPLSAMHSWLSVAKATFDAALKNGNVFHLWGHSWEIEKYGMWDEFEKFLEYIGNRNDCEYATNGELV